MSVCAYSAVSEETRAMRYGQYALFFQDGSLCISDGEKTIALDLKNLELYDPTKSTALLPYIHNGAVDYKLTTVKDSLALILSVLILYQKEIEIRDKLVKINNDIEIQGKKISILGDGKNSQLVSLEYYNAHKSEMSGDAGYSAFEYYQFLNYPNVIRDKDAVVYNTRLQEYIASMDATYHDYDLFDLWQSKKYEKYLSYEDYADFKTRKAGFSISTVKNYSVIDYWQYVNYNKDVIAITDTSRADEYDERLKAYNTFVDETTTESGEASASTVNPFTVFNYWQFVNYSNYITQDAYDEYNTRLTTYKNGVKAKTDLTVFPDYQEKLYGDIVLCDGDEYARRLVVYQASIKGAKGDKGDKGDRGVAGYSAFDLWQLDVYENVIPESRTHTKTWQYIDPAGFGEKSNIKLSSYLSEYRNRLNMFMRDRGKNAINLEDEADKILEEITETTTDAEKAAIMNRYKVKLADWINWQHDKMVNDDIHGSHAFTFSLIYKEVSGYPGDDATAWEIRYYTYNLFLAGEISIGAAAEIGKDALDAANNAQKTANTAKKLGIAGTVLGAIGTLFGIGNAAVEVVSYTSLQTEITALASTVTALESLQTANDAGRAVFENALDGIEDQVPNIYKGSFWDKFSGYFKDMAAGIKANLKGFTKLNNGYEAVSEFGVELAEDAGAVHLGIVSRAAEDLGIGGDGTGDDGGAASGGALGGGGTGTGEETPEPINSIKDDFTKWYYTQYPSMKSVLAAIKGLYAAASYDAKTDNISYIKTVYLMIAELLDRIELNAGDAYDDATIESGFSSIRAEIARVDLTNCITYEIEKEIKTEYETVQEEKEEINPETGEKTTVTITYENPIEKIIDHPMLTFSSVEDVRLKGADGVNKSICYDDTQVRNLIGKKADATHTHSELGAITLNGDITCPDVGNTGCRKIHVVCGKDDYGRFEVGATDCNEGYLLLATGNNMNEPIYLKQENWNGEFRQATLLDAAGNTQFPGTIVSSNLKTDNDDRLVKCETWIEDYEPFDSSALETKISDKADATHTHTISEITDAPEPYDDSEMRSIIATKAALSHTHTLSDITDINSVMFRLDLAHLPKPNQSIRYCALLPLYKADGTNRKYYRFKGQMWLKRSDAYIGEGKLTEFDFEIKGSNVTVSCNKLVWDIYIGGWSGYGTNQIGKVCTYQDKQYFCFYSIQYNWSSPGCLECSGQGNLYATDFTIVEESEVTFDNTYVIKTTTPDQDRISTVEQWISDYKAPDPYDDSGLKTLINGKSDSGHKHKLEDITDYVAPGPYDDGPLSNRVSDCESWIEGYRTPAGYDDGPLSGRVDTLSESITSNCNELGKQIASEAKERGAAVDGLTKLIATETSDRKAADTVITDQIKKDKEAHDLEYAEYKKHTHSKYETAASRIDDTRLCYTYKIENLDGHMDFVANILAAQVKLNGKQLALEEHTHSDLQQADQELSNGIKDINDRIEPMVRYIGAPYDCDYFAITADKTGVTLEMKGLLTSYVIFIGDTNQLFWSNYEWTNVIGSATSIQLIDNWKVRWTLGTENYSIGIKVYDGSMNSLYETTVQRIFNENFICTFKNVIDVIYPIGSIYINAGGTDAATMDATHPNDRFPGTTWEQLTNRFLYASSTPGQTGGEEKHTLTISEMPSHSHGQKVTANPNTGSCRRADFDADAGNYGPHDQGVNTYDTGGGAAHNNMPPYLTVLMWKRIA